jgi:hypothetical protein
VVALTSTKIEDEVIALAVGLLVKTVSDSGSSELIDNNDLGLLSSLLWELLKYAGAVTTASLNLRLMRRLALKMLHEHG